MLSKEMVPECLFIISEEMYNPRPTPGNVYLLVEDLLDITKVRSDKTQFNESPFDFNGLVLEINEQMKVTPTHHTIDLQLSKSKMVYADRNRVGQVIFYQTLSNILPLITKYW